jgi:hypothetical protein
MSAHQVAVIRRRLSIGLPAYSGEYYVAEAILNGSPLVDADASSDDFRVLTYQGQAAATLLRASRGGRIRPSYLWKTCQRNTEELSMGVYPTEGRCRAGTACASGLPTARLQGAWS